MVGGECTPPGAACAATSRRFGEVKGPIFVWLVLALYGVALVFFLRLQAQTLLAAVLEVALFYGFSLAFLAGFVGLHEKRRSLSDVFAGLGLRKAGTGRSLLWGVMLLPAVFIVSLAGSGLLVALLGSLPSQFTRTGPQPSWYLWFALVESFFPVALVEEMFGRGYVLDRLLPTHPCNLRVALPAILFSAGLFTLWHLPSYLAGYGLSVAWALGFVALNAFPLSVVVGIAYVRSGTRNIAGVILLHFLLDALPVAAAMVTR